VSVARELDFDLMANFLALADKTQSIDKRGTGYAFLFGFYFFFRHSPRTRYVNSRTIPVEV
jgi:hypothetical protein